MDFINRDFIEYLILLNKNEVKYVLVGGMAVNIHGYRRSTGDMDLFVESTGDNHKKLRKVHLEFGMHMGEMEVLEYFLDTSKFDVFTFGVSPIQIDIMTACKGLTFEEAYKNSIKIELDNNLIANVIHYHELIIAKRAAGRLRDLADIEELEKLKKSDD